MHDGFVGLNWHKNKDDFERRPNGINTNKPDWKTAPLAAQFYSAGLFRMYREGVEFYWHDGKWVQNSERPKPLEWYVEKSDFEDRPKLSSAEWGNGNLPPVGSYFEFSYNGKSWEERIMLFNDGISCLMARKNCPTDRRHYKSSDPYMEFRPIYTKKKLDVQIYTKKKLDAQMRPEMDKPDWIEWDGKGNPPVGTVCLMYWGGVFHCKAEIIQYRRNGNQVIFWNIDKDHVDGAEIPTAQFYPLNLEREKWSEGDHPPVGTVCDYICDEQGRFAGVKVEHYTSDGKSVVIQDGKEYYIKSLLEIEFLPCSENQIP